MLWLIPEALNSTCGWLVTRGLVESFMNAKVIGVRTH